MSDHVRTLSEHEARALELIEARRRIARGMRENAHLMREVADLREREAADEERAAADLGAQMGLPASFRWHRDAAGDVKIIDMTPPEATPPAPPAERQQEESKP